MHRYTIIVFLISTTTTSYATTFTKGIDGCRLSQYYLLKNQSALMAESGTERHNW